MVRVLGPPLGAPLGASLPIAKSAALALVALPETALLPLALAVRRLLLPAVALGRRRGCLALIALLGCGG